MPDMTEPVFNMNIEEEDLSTYIRVYKALKEGFRSRTRLFLAHVEDDMWELQIVNLVQRDMLEFCANVYAELPSETVKLVEEAVSEAAELMHQIPAEVDDDGSLEDDEDEYEDDTEEEEEDGVNSDGETPSEEVQRKLKAKIVRKTGNSAVTVEVD